MKGVILGICPEAQLVDISHEIKPFAVAQAAYTLAQTWECFPKRTVHLVVVDPGVGGSRRPILAEAGGHSFVGPDNGVLTMALTADCRARVREIRASLYFREPVSRTFHGRDIFAPVAAHRASGVAVSRFGGRIEDCVQLEGVEPVGESGNAWRGTVLHVDHFGNLITNFGWKEFGWIAGERFLLRVGSRSLRQYCRDYGSAPLGEPFAIRGSAGYVEISVNKGDASQLLKVEAGAFIVLKKKQ